MLMLTKVRRQAGDTIVEVLICIAVISTVLTGAFRIAQSMPRHNSACKEKLKVCALIWLPSQQQAVYQEIFALRGAQYLSL